MRHKDSKKILKRALKYAVLNKETQKITLLRYKTQVSALIGVSTRTLDRKIPYENSSFGVFEVENVV